MAISRPMAQSPDPIMGGGLWSAEQMNTIILGLIAMDSTTAPFHNRAQEAPGSPAL
jgi:hypothetical protein